MTVQRWTVQEQTLDGWTFSSMLMLQRAKDAVQTSHHEVTEDKENGSQRRSLNTVDPFVVMHERGQLIVLLLLSVTESNTAF